MYRRLAYQSENRGVYIQFLEIDEVLFCKGAVRKGWVVLRGTKQLRSFV